MKLDFNCSKDIREEAEKSLLVTISYGTYCLVSTAPANLLVWDTSGVSRVALMLLSERVDFSGSFSALHCL